MVPIAREAYLEPYLQLQLARIHLLTGEPERGLDQLEMPFYVSPGGLRLDPAFDRIRASLRFQRLLVGG